MTPSGIEPATIRLAAVPQPTALRRTSRQISKPWQNQGEWICGAFRVHVGDGRWKNNFSLKIWQRSQMGWSQLSATAERGRERLPSEIWTATADKKLSILKRNILCIATCLMIWRRRTGNNEHFYMISLVTSIVKLRMLRNGELCDECRPPGVARVVTYWWQRSGWCGHRKREMFVTFWEKSFWMASTRKTMDSEWVQ